MPFAYHSKPFLPAYNTSRICARLYCRSIGIQVESGYGGATITFIAYDIRLDIREGVSVTYVPILILVALVLVVSAFWSRRRSKQRFAQLQDQFTAWVTSDAVADADVKAWIADLPETEIHGLVSRLLSRFQELGMELDWLWDDRLHNRETHNILQYAAVNDLRSRMQGAQAQEDFQAFRVFKTLDEKPKSKASRALSLQLYESLVADGVLGVSTGDLLEGSRRKRQAHIASAIRQAAVDHPETFHQTLKKVVAGNLAATAAEEAAAETPPASTATGSAVEAAEQNGAKTELAASAAADDNKAASEPVA